VPGICLSVRFSMAQIFVIFTPIYRRPYQRLFNYTGTKALVPKCEIFNGSDFHDFYTIKSVWGGGATLGLK
jgi:hypothetical protein